MRAPGATARFTKSVSDRAEASATTWSRTRPAAFPRTSTAPTISADDLVLGSLPHEHAHARAVGGAAPSPARAQLRDRLGPAAQAAAGHGQPRAGTVEGQGRGGRN